MQMNALIWKNKYQQPVNATLELLHDLGYHPNEKKINEFLLSHPGYPSLLSISDCLKECRIENAAIKVDQTNLEEYPLPFLIHTKEGFKVISDIKADNPLLKDWNGIALLLNDQKEGSEKANEFLMKNRKPPVLLLLTGITLLLAIFIIPTVENALLMMLKLTGVIISSVLLWYQVDKNNPAMKQICGKEAGSGSDCTAVLDSAGAKIFKDFSWSEAGFFYFTGGFLSLLFIPSAFNYIAWMNLIALPYIAYSLIYQKFVIKKWCKLCLSVQAILLTEFIVALSFGTLNTFPVLAWSLAGPVASMFLIVAIAWLALKPILQKFTVTEQRSFELARIKRDPAVINTLLEQQHKLQTRTEGIGIELGDPSAKHRLVAVSNPYCPPCSKAHESLKEIMDEKDLRLQIIFTGANDPHDSKASPAKHLMAIARKGNEELTKRALDDWYLNEKKDYRAFAEKYKMNGELKKQDAEIQKMDEWCKQAGVSSTPTIFVDGYQLPENYKAEDLKYLFSE